LSMESDCSSAYPARYCTLAVPSISWRMNSAKPSAAAVHNMVAATAVCWGLRPMRRWRRAKKYSSARSTSRTRWKPTQSAIGVSELSGGAGTIRCYRVKDIGRELTLLVDEPYGFQKEIRGGLERLRADLVDRVLGGVVPCGIADFRVERPVVGVDHVQGGHAALEKRQMVVLLVALRLEDIGSVACVDRGLAEDGAQPPGRLLIFQDVEVLVADHVSNEQSLDALQCPVSIPLCSEMPSAVGVVNLALIVPVLDCLLAIVEDQPDGISLRRMRAQIFADGNQQGCGAGAVIRADKVDVAQRVIGFVVGYENDGAVALAGEFDDEVAHRLLAGGSVGGELIHLEVAVRGLGLEVVLDELLGRCVARRAVVAFRGDAEKLLRQGEDRLAGDEAGGGLGGSGGSRCQCKDHQSDQHRKANAAVP